MITAKNKSRPKHNKPEIISRGPIYDKISQAYKKHRNESVSTKSINYEELILLFKEQADYDRGTTWAINESQDTLIRSAAKATGNMFSNADYIQQILNMHRAAVEIIELQILKEIPKAAIKEQINGRAQQLIANYLEGNFFEEESQCAALLRSQNNEIVELLVSSLNGLLSRNYTRKELDDSLRLAESYAGLKDRHYNIETHIEIADKQFIQRDIKISELTKEQKSLFINLEAQPWYKSLSKLEQELVKLHAKQIADGKHVIPTALRAVPGARNLYKKELVEIIDTPEGREKILNMYFHSGTIASYNKGTEAAQTIASSSFKQIQAYLEVNSAGKAKELTFVTLSSRRSLDASDRLVVRQTETAVGQRFAEVAVGPFRRLDSSNFKEFIYENKLFEKLLNVFPELQNKAELTPLRNYLEAHNLDLFGFKFREAMKLAKNMSNSINIADDLYKESAASALPAIIELKRHLSYQAGLLGGIRRFFALPGSNNNARTVASLTALSNLLPENPILLSCKSGKDRTGYCSYLADLTSLYRREPGISESLISQKLIEAGHIQFLAACNGGKPGCFGLKGVDIDGEIKGQEKLFSKAAHYSSSMPSLRHVFDSRRVIHGVIESLKDTWGRVTGKSASYVLHKAEEHAEQVSKRNQKEYYKEYKEPKEKNEASNSLEPDLKETLSKDRFSAPLTRLQRSLSTDSGDSGIDIEPSSEIEIETTKKLSSAAKEYKATEGGSPIGIVLEETEKITSANNSLHHKSHLAGKSALLDRQG